MRYQEKTNEGFTLIELLVVISIISLLSSVVMASLNTARSKARDSKRIQDMRQIQLALELYKNNTGSYPSTPSERTNSCRTSVLTNTPTGIWSVGLNALVTQGLIPAIPNDPLNSGADGANRLYCYSYVSNPSRDYGTCLDIQTGSFNSVNDANYEYVLYLSLENTPTSGKVIHWHNIAANPISAPDTVDSHTDSLPINVNTKPYNYCIVGPKK